MALVEFDTHWFPLVIQRWPPTLSDAELEAFFSSNEGVARRAIDSNTFYAVVGIGYHSTLNAEQRGQVAKWAREMPRDLRERVVGAFVVLGSPLQRGALSAVRWFLPELKDVYALDSLDAAVHRALAALEAKGVIAPGRPDEILRYIEAQPARPSLNPES